MSHGILQAGLICLLHKVLHHVCLCISISFPCLNSFTRVSHMAQWAWKAVVKCCTDDHHMMDAFTGDADAARAAEAEALAVEPLSAGLSPAPNENIDPAATPPSPPTKHSSPSTPLSTPKFTPLRRRFLEEVTMSPASPPQTPSGKKRDSPNKGRESPAKPKLEVGKNGFYFSCELPMSKVTPKKNGTPGGRTQRSRTPSPTKDGTKGTPLRREATAKQAISRSPSPVRQTPTRTPRRSPLRDTGTAPQNMIPTFARATPTPSKETMSQKHSPTKHLFDTPSQKLATPDPSKRVKGAFSSPAKSIKLASRLAEGLSPTPTPVLRIPPECLEDVTEDAVKVHGFAGPEVTDSDDALKHTAKATATGKGRAQPTRKPSFDIGGLMAGLSTHIQDLSLANVTAVKQNRETNGSEPPTPLRRAAEKLETVAFDVIPQTESQPASSESKPSRSSSEVLPVVRTVLPSRTKETPLRYLPLLFPKLEESQDEVAPETSKKHVKWNESGLKSPKSSGSNRTGTSLRPGTNPTVLLAMRREMDRVHESMERATGQEYKFRGMVNSFELPVMSSMLYMTDQQIPLVEKPKRVLTRTIPDVSECFSTSTASSVRASMLMNPRRPSGIPVLGSPRTPRWPIAGKTLTQTRREKVASTTEDETAARLISSRKGTARPANTADSKLTTSTIKQPSALGAASTPSRSRLKSTPARPIPLATPAKSSAAAGGGIPRSTHKSVFGTKPHPTNATPVSKTPASSHKSLYTTPRPINPRKTVCAVVEPPYDPRTDPRPYEQKFASAIDIAGRIQGWNSEDRKKASAAAALARPVVKTAAVTPTPAPGARFTKTPTKLVVGGKKKETHDEEESYTPEGSPTKPISHAKPTSPTKLPSPTTKSLHPHKPTKSPPKTPAPAAKTPGPKKTAVSRLRVQARTPNPRTPHTSKMPVFDRNALRTPSKAIEGSLDKAIDRKIEEDARSGREFTPSGNRVADLIAARGYGEGRKPSK
jgi:hypothetical protein